MAEINHPREWLQGETARWVKAGLIDERQAAAILTLYPAQPGAARDRTVLIITILGSVLVGAGVILFFAANWPRIPAAAKLASVLLATVGAYSGGYYLQFVHKDYPRVGHSLILLGSLFYGASIWLIAQTYHLESRFPNGYLLWGAGLLPMIWVTYSRPILYLATAVLTIWTATEQGAFESYNLLYPVLLLGLLLPMARRLTDALAEAGALAGLFLWLAINMARGDSGNVTVGNEGLMIARAMILYGSSVAGVGLARLGDIRAYLGVGSFLALLGTYILTFDVYGSNVLPSVLAGTPYQLAATGVLAAATTTAGWLFWKRAEPGRIALVAGLGVLVLAALGAGALPETARMIAFNLLLFTVTVGLVVFGVQRRVELLVNLGLVAFVVHIFTRYVDLFWGAMERSIFFVVGGILLLGGGWLLERNRRRWVGQWGGEPK